MLPLLSSLLGDILSLGGGTLQEGPLPFGVDPRIRQLLSLLQYDRSNNNNYLPLFP